MPVLLHLPVGRSVSMVRFQHRSVSRFPLVCPNSCIPSFDASRSQERLGPPKFFNVSLPACHGLRTPADHTPPCQDGGVRVAFGGVKTLGIRDSHVDAVPALQGARSPLRPPGYAVDASPIVFTVSPRLRHGRKTRYGWVAHPSPTGTFTLRETPSLSWRDNARHQARPEAGARYERTLEGVACMPWLGDARRS